MGHIDVFKDAAINPVAAVALLRKRERSWRKSGRKKDLYRFLNTVSVLYAAWRKADVAASAAHRLVLIAGAKRRKGRHPIRTIIDAVSRADRRTESRWTRALRFAWRERRNYEDLQDCLRSNGGIAGCADKWAELRAEMRTPPGFVRVGGEHRVPLIPLFLGVEMLTPPG